MKFYVYVIKSEDGYSYTGVTSDLRRRLSEHNDKSFSKWTKRGNNWKIIYHEEFIPDQMLPNAKNGLRAVLEENSLVQKSSLVSF